MHVFIILLSIAICMAILPAADPTTAASAAAKIVKTTTRFANMVAVTLIRLPLPIVVNYCAPLLFLSHHLLAYFSLGRTSFLIKEGAHNPEPRAATAHAAVKVWVP